MRQIRKSIAWTVVAVAAVVVVLPVLYLLSLDYLSSVGMPISREKVEGKISAKLPASTRVLGTRYYPVRDRQVLLRAKIETSDIDVFLKSLAEPEQVCRFENGLPLSGDSEGYTYDVCDYTSIKGEVARNLSDCPPHWWDASPGKRFIYYRARYPQDNRADEHVFLLINVDHPGYGILSLRWIDM